MHDPMTVAFDIRYPWRSKPPSKTWPKGYRETFITVWHVDPERDGSDDSCGWSFPRLSKQQISRLTAMAQDEARHPWFAAVEAKETTSPSDAMALFTGLFVLVGEMIGEKVSVSEAERWSIDAVHNPALQLRSNLAFLRGYHSNSDDDEYWRADNAHRLFCTVGKIILKKHRHWWQHPQWHIHHWNIQIHPVQKLKRWLFSRCSGCGKRFPRGYSPISHNWNSGGPRWFKSEQDVYHSGCNGVAVRKDL